jgi:Asp-tRNA(Asn)/Glu-tRNA(Gln) amidotransferase A subunit family amidase
VNIAGLPGLSVPCGLSEGLPVGLQFIGRAWDEGTLFRLGRAYEAITADTEWRGLEPTDLGLLESAATPTPAERMAATLGS